MTRVSKSPEERRGELIAAAQQLFFQKGYENTSISDITKTVGVAKGTFYYHFESKDDVLAALVDVLTAQAIAVMDEIVEDTSLSAVEKWQLAFQTTGAWKTARKEELVAILRVMHSPGNDLLRQRIARAAVEQTAQEIAKIIRQGVEEGVFDVELVEETARIAMLIMRSVSDYLADLLLRPDEYENHFTLARRKVQAIQSSVERVLGAEPGTLPLLDDATLGEWFSNGSASP